MAVVQRRFQLRLGFETVAGIEQRRKMRVDIFERAEIAVQELADHLAEPGIVLGKTGGIDGVAAFTSGDDSVKQIHLRALAAAIDAFDGNELAMGPSVYIRTQISLGSRIIHHRSRPQASLTGDILRRNAARARIRNRT